MLSGRVIPGPLAGGHQRLQIGRHLDLSAVPGLYPAFGPFKPVAAGNEAAPAMVTPDEVYTICLTANYGITGDQAAVPSNRLLQEPRPPQLWLRRTSFTPLA